MNSTKGCLLSKALVWLRRDLRLYDHHALSAALKDHDEVYLCFVFDKLILDKLPKEDKRLTFIHQGLEEISQDLSKHQSDIHILHGDPTEEVPKLFKKLKCDALYLNRDYEPYAQKRDETVHKEIKNQGGSCKIFKDIVFYEKGEILNKQGEVYKVFTPYKKAWLEKFNDTYGGVVPQFKVNLKNLAKVTDLKKSIKDHDWHKTLGFKKDSALLTGGVKEAKKHLKEFKKVIEDYEKARDFPAMKGTSHLSPYIRFGMISIRELLKVGIEGGHKVWTSELIWREFYQMILSQFPHVEKKSYRPEYDNIKWRGKKKEFEAWKEGMTGFPLIDASMRCFKETGMMHNRLRMVVASFLCKTLLVDWKKGEEYFAQKLLDFDLAANNGGWQWCSSSGTDAQPYFRIFNPTTQSEKFDPDAEFIKEWCPELKGFSKKKIHAPWNADMIEQSEASCTIGEDYPCPVVDYKEKRHEALEMYKEGLK